MKYILLILSVVMLSGCSSQDKYIAVANYICDGGDMGSMHMTGYDAFTISDYVSEKLGKNCVVLSIIKN